MALVLRMKMVEKANMSWEQEQIIKITALYSVLYDFFEKEAMSMYKKKILYQFLFPKNHGHKKYNTYKRQFRTLVEKSKNRLYKSSKKLVMVKPKACVNIEGAKVMDLVHSDVFYNPLVDIGDFRYSITEIAVQGEETCLFCNKRFADLKSHYKSELEVSKDKRIVIKVMEMKKLAIEEQVIEVDVKENMLVGELKRAICELLPVPVSRQQLLSNNKVLKNNEVISSSELILREKKK